MWGYGGGDGVGGWRQGESMTGIVSILRVVGSFLVLFSLRAWYSLPDFVFMHCLLATCVRTSERGLG